MIRPIFPREAEFATTPEACAAIGAYNAARDALNHDRAVIEGEGRALVEGAPRLTPGAAAEAVERGKGLAARRLALLLREMQLPALLTACEQPMMAAHDAKLKELADRQTKRTAELDKVAAKNGLDAAALRTADKVLSELRAARSHIDGVRRDIPQACALTAEERAWLASRANEARKIMAGVAGVPVFIHPQTGAVTIA